MNNPCNFLKDKFQLQVNLLNDLKSCHPACIYVTHNGGIGYAPHEDTTMENKCNIAATVREKRSQAKNFRKWCFAGKQWKKIYSRTWTRSEHVRRNISCVLGSTRIGPGNALWTLKSRKNGGKNNSIVHMFELPSSPPDIFFRCVQYMYKYILYLYIYVAPPVNFSLYNYLIKTHSRNLACDDDGGGGRAAELLSLPHKTVQFIVYQHLGQHYARSWKWARLLNKSKNGEQLKVTLQITIIINKLTAMAIGVHERVRRVGRVPVHTQTRLPTKSFSSRV